VAQLAKTIGNDEAGTADAVDPELVALPAPPRGRRLIAMTMMALVVVASIGMLASLRADIGYYFATPTAINLGDVGDVDPAELAANTYVTVRGTPMASNTVHYQRVLSGDAYAVFPLAGQRNVFVQLPLEDAHQARTMARSEWSGRLVTFGQLGGRFSTIRGYLHQTMDMPVSSESFLLLADEAPGTYGWALGLAALCILFVVLNVGLMIRWFRPIQK
jgi:hypothetical protein